MEESPELDRFPYNVPTELTEDEGRQLEAVLARGGPPWVQQLLRELGKHECDNQDSGN